MANEKELVSRLKGRIEIVESLEEQLKEAKSALDRVKQEILEHFDETGTERTATYDGIGFVSRLKPRLYASCSQENFETLVKHLEAENRQDLIKLTVHPATLASYVSEQIENGKEIPSCISYYLQGNVRLYAKA